MTSPYDIDRAKQKALLNRKTLPSLPDHITLATVTCACPIRLSDKTVDSYIGKLQAIFHLIRRDGECDKRLGLGNPASNKSVKDFLRLVTAEQLQARVTPKQGTPFFVDKLTQ